MAERAPLLHWLPANARWHADLAELASLRGEREAFWRAATKLANHQLDFVQTQALDAVVRGVYEASPPERLAQRSIRLALLGSSTFSQLHAGIRVAGLRRGLWISTYENGYGQYYQESLAPDSALHRFRPDAVLLALDPYHVSRGVGAGDPRMEMAKLQARLEACWSRIAESFSCRVVQQSVLPVLPRVLGSNEDRSGNSRAAFIGRFNRWLQEKAAAGTVDLLSIDGHVAAVGLRDWHDVALWHCSKQEISPKAAPLYGELLVRILAAQAGRSSKCLVLDLDNTLWGGEIGEIGPSGIALGEGSTLGEAYLAMQRYVLSLAQRGIVLAACAGNDSAQVFTAFERHPEMLLKRGDFAALVFDAGGKPDKLRRIAAELRLGLDTLVFVDDSPVERALVRRELPMVAVPEMGEEPALYPYVLQDAGYFEAVAVSGDEARRTEPHLHAAASSVAPAAATDLESYLGELEMELRWKPFEASGVKRIAQLMNKANQFNLSSRRYTEAELRAIIDDASCHTFQFRLIDRYGDNGVIAVVITRDEGDGERIDTWLMSCRVVGREVERAVLNVVACEARARGAAYLLGEYLPTERNALVADHYARLGFRATDDAASAGYRGRLSIVQFAAAEVPMAVSRA